MGTFDIWGRARSLLNVEVEKIKPFFPYYTFSLYISCETTIMK
jgi:hypothetical protein